MAVYYDSQETVLMIARRFGVKRDTVVDWVCRHDQPKGQSKRVIFALSKRKLMNGTAGKQDATDSRLKSLEAEAEPERERIRSIVLEKMIDIAGRELRVDIRKKFGVNRSKK